MKILVTGVKGQLGYDIVEEAKSRGIEAVGVDINEMDITNAEEVKQVITDSKVDAVIHCAAYTAVDAAEENNEICFKVNVEGTKNIAQVCSDLDIKMMYFSTDYVFDGQGEEPWKPYDERTPLNYYGQTKYEGELAVEELVEQHFIVRIAWVFGINGNNFVKTMLKLADGRDELNVVDDQIGSPTYTYDLAKLCLDMIDSDKFGTYHATNEGYCSWYDFAVEIFNQAGVDIKVNPVDSSAFPVKASRPKNSRMDKTELVKNGFRRMRPWQEALQHYIGVLNNQ